MGYSITDDENMCGRNQHLNIFFEWYEHDLELEILERIDKKDYFNEQELWVIYNSVLSAMKSLHAKGIYHGDIRPLNIMLNENG